MELTEIRKKLKKAQDKERYEHTKGVMYTAGCLAMAHGYDIEKSMLAGLLHDCAKCIPNDEKLKLCEENDIICIHYGSTLHPQKVLASIRAMGVKAGIAINPATPVCVLEDILPDVDMVLCMTVNPGFAGQKLIPATLDKITRIIFLSLN